MRTITTGVPVYYAARIRGVADMYAIAKAHGITNPATCHALKYLLRAGRKPGETAREALAKAGHAIQRAIRLETDGQTRGEETGK
jgi:hypothetical protein